MSDVPFTCKYCDEYIPKGCAVSFDNDLYCSGSHRDAGIRKAMQALTAENSQLRADKEKLTDRVIGSQRALERVLETNAFLGAIRHQEVVYAIEFNAKLLANLSEGKQ